MKLLYITASFPFGSGESFLIPEINELLRQGHEVIVIPLYPRGKLLHEDALDLLKLTVTKPLLSLSILLKALIGLLHKPKVLSSFKLLLNNCPPKILIKNLLVWPKAVWLSWQAGLWQVEHIHAHWAATTSTVALIVGETNNIPWSFTAHRWDIIENNLLAQKVNKAAFVRFISQSGFKMAADIVPLPQKKCFVIHMGVKPADKINTRIKPDHSCVILCPANLIPVKGHNYLLQAMSRLKKRNIQATLWIAGQGELLPGLQASAKKLGIEDKVKFLGELSHCKILDFYETGKADIVVLPSIDLGNGLHEGIPVSLMEAMSFGIPTVSTFTGGIPELLHDGAGLLVPHKDPEALAGALEKLITNQLFRNMLGNKGQARIRQEFSVAQTTEQLINLMAHHRSREYEYIPGVLTQS